MPGGLHVLQGGAQPRAAWGGKSAGGGARAVGGMAGPVGSVPAGCTPRHEQRMSAPATMTASLHQAGRSKDCCIILFSGEPLKWRGRPLDRRIAEGSHRHSEWSHFFPGWRAEKELRCGAPGTRDPRAQAEDGDGSA